MGLGIRERSLPLAKTGSTSRGWRCADLYYTAYYAVTAIRATHGT